MRSLKRAARKLERLCITVGRRVCPTRARLAQANARNKFFYEGWAQYGEIVMLEQGYYADPRDQLTAWRMVLLRAARVWLDPHLHTSGITPEKAAEFLHERLLMDPAEAAAEVRRHMLEPGMKVTYYVGMLQILALRRELGISQPELSQREFHDRLLQWPLPIPVAAEIVFRVELPGLKSWQERAAGSVLESLADLTTPE